MLARVLLLQLVKLCCIFPKVLLLLEVLLGLWRSKQRLLLKLLLVKLLVVKGLLLLLQGRVPQALLHQQLLRPTCRHLPEHAWLLLLLLLHVRCLRHLQWASAAAVHSCSINLRLLPIRTVGRPEVICTVLWLLLHCRPHLSDLPCLLLLLTLLLLLLWLYNLPWPVLLPALRCFCLPLRRLLSRQPPLPEVCTPVIKALPQPVLVRRNIILFELPPAAELLPGRWQDSSGCVQGPRKLCSSLWQQVTRPDRGLTMLLPPAAAAACLLLLLLT
jgi:hypothetical protein